MKKNYTLFVALIITGSLMAQAPQSFKYQAVKHDAGGTFTDSVNTQNLSAVLAVNNDGRASQIKNLVDPTDDQDTATKAYIDQMIAEIFTQIAGGKVTDYDENSYNTVKIGDQIWMAENLKTTHYASGDAILDGTGAGDISGETEPKYWFAYNDDLNNVSTYGRLYTWYTVTDSRNVCPDGWHVPSVAEWTQLTDYLGGESVAGGKLKETGTTHWNSPNTGATNENGFTAIPGGYRSLYGAFSLIGSNGHWWSYTENSVEIAYYRLLYYDHAYISRSYFFKKFGFSVRCLRD